MEPSWLDRSIDEIAHKRDVNRVDGFLGLLSFRVADRPIDLNVADVAMVLAVARCGSVTVAAREHHVTPPQVSKAVKRVVRAVGYPIFVRRGTSIVLSETGRERIGELRAVVDAARRVVGDIDQDRLALAAPSYLCDAFAGTVAGAIAPRGLRVLELGLGSIEAHATHAVFQLALSPRHLALSDLWSSVHVSDIVRTLYTTPTVARQLGRNPSIEDVCRVPFVFSVNFANGELVAGNDDCPIPRDARLRGHEATTISGALDLAARSDQFAFGPTVAAQPWVASGALVRVDVEGVTTEAPLFLHVHGEHVTGATLRAIRGAFAELRAAA